MGRVYYSVYPTYDTIKVGDTLWVEAHFSHKLEDWKTHEIRDYTGVPLPTYLILSRLIDTQNIKSFNEEAYKFNVVVIDGQIDSKAKTIYADRNDSFHFKAGIVPNDTGFYQLGLLFIPQFNSLKYQHKQVVETWDDDYIHFLSDAPAQINKGNSTKDRAIKRG